MSEGGRPPPDDNIHRLPGAILPHTFDRQSDVIEQLELLLQQAEKGELVAIAFATVVAHPGDPLGAGIGAGWIGKEGSKFHMAASIELLKFRFLHESLCGEEP